MSEPLPPPVPTATYRLQFNPSFTFRDATEIIPYLSRLGISHVYASPILKARAGSAHGYDITDHNSLNPEIGTDAEFEAFVEALHTHRMGLIIDIVPNHMGIGFADNSWWLDVLEWGEASPYSAYFDIDWMPAKVELHHKVLVPVLGEHYGTVLERGDLELRLEPETGEFSVWYHEHRFPIGPRHYSRVFAARRDLLRDSGEFDAATREMVESLALQFRSFPAAIPAQREREGLRRRAATLKSQLGGHARSDTGFAKYLRSCLSHFNGKIEDPLSHLALHRLLQLQPYRLAYWRVAGHEINYRRFFDINGLGALRMEFDTLFDAAHRLVSEWIVEGKVQGLRVDHIDGLYDPAAYCRKLQRVALPPSERTAADGKPIYVVVEKILAQHERLRTDWPVAGTTGYEFASLVNGLFVDPGGLPRLERTWRQFADGETNLDRILYAAKKQLMQTTLAGELNVLANELDRISESSWRTRDFTREDLREALGEVVACFPVYRTYISSRQITADDRRDINWAVGQARGCNRAIDSEVFDFVLAALTTDLVREHRGVYNRRQVIRFAMRFQQYTAPVMAKAMEDTSFYRHFRLASLNEVGSDPRRFGTSIQAFHLVNADRHRHWPHSMLTTATHDTKRGEDARTRIDVLSELAEEWTQRVRRWTVLNRAKRREVDGDPAPSPRDEYLIYQTIVGAWPSSCCGAAAPDPAEMAGYVKRLQAYMTKAVREAKLVSSWARPNIAYEEAVGTFVARILDVASPNPFFADIVPFACRVAALAAINGLAQTTLKLCAPGVSDVYQGTEFWDLSFVDPDNRRPVDFTARARALDDLDTATRRNEPFDSESVASHWHDGKVKLYVTQKLLRLRRRAPELLRDGEYIPLNVTGEKSELAIAFARRSVAASLIVVAPRFVTRLYPSAQSGSFGRSDWRDTTVVLPPDFPGQPSDWMDVLLGLSRTPRASGNGHREYSFDLAKLCDELPVAVIAGGPGAVDLATESNARH